jgi:ABC-type branched-subunit amino acid transport system ATPase component
MTPPTAAPLVQLNGIVKRYGGVIAIEDVDLDIRRGEILGLIGPNGSGKTTLVDVLSGFVSPTAGDMTIDGAPSRFLPAEQVVRRHRFARTFQGARLARSMTVAENVLVGMHGSFRSPTILLPGGGRSGRQAREKVAGLLERLGIAHLATRPAGQLTSGDQRRVEIARAMATDPRLMLMDEPAAGMNPDETEALIGLLDDLSRHATVLLIEHNMALVMRIADRVAVLDAGRRIALGTPHEVADDPVVQQAYLGRRDPHAD